MGRLSLELYQDSQRSFQGMNLWAMLQEDPQYASSSANGRADFVSESYRRATGKLILPVYIDLVSVSTRFPIWVGLMSDKSFQDFYHFSVASRRSPHEGGPAVSVLGVSIRARLQK